LQRSYFAQFTYFKFQRPTPRRRRLILAFTITRRASKINDFFAKNGDFPRFRAVWSVRLASRFENGKNLKKIEKSPLRGSQSRL